MTVVQSGAATPATANTYGFQLFNGVGPTLTLVYDGSYAYLQSWGGYPLQINNQGNNTLLNVGGGNVGIGTTIPLNSSIVDARGLISANGLISNGTKFTVGTCTASSRTGGATAGQIVTSNGSGCVITLGGLTAPNGWACAVGKPV